MNILDMITEIGASTMGGITQNLKEADPKKLEELTRMFNNLTEVAIHIMRVNPEFRTQFARVHMEFMKYPECRQVIDDSVNAIQQYKPDLLTH